MTLTAPQPLHAAVYARISRDATGAGAGVDRQREACLKLAAERGWLVDPDHVIVENDMSATRGKRPGYARLVALAQAGEVDVIIAWSMDRLTRKVTEIESMIAMAETTGTKVVTATGDIDLTTDAGRLVGRILASVARGEVERKGSRQRASNEQRANQGRCSVSRCYGYESDGAVRESEAPYIKELFARFVGGAPITTLARWLTAEGQRAAGHRSSAKGPGWSRMGVRTVLSNRRYIAEVWRLGEYVGPGTWAPLVDVETFAAAQARLADPTRTTTTGPNRKWLGAGVYRCGVCAAEGVESTVVTHNSTAAGANGTRLRYRYYKCSTGFHLSRRAEPIDAFVEEVVCERLRRPEVAAALGGNRNTAAATALRDEANGLRADEVRFALDQVGAKNYTPLQVRVMTAALHERLDEIACTLADLGSRSALAAVAGRDDPAAAWLEFDVHQRAAVLDALVTVTLTMDDVRGRPFNPASVIIAPRT